MLRTEGTYYPEKSISDLSVILLRLGKFPSNLLVVDKYDTEKETFISIRTIKSTIFCIIKLCDNVLMKKLVMKFLGLRNDLKSPARGYPVFCERRYSVSPRAIFGSHLNTQSHFIVFLGRIDLFVLSLI